jgi:RNA polymerase sigma-70 factor (ECF subfamily)
VARDASGEPARGQGRGEDVVSTPDAELVRRVARGSAPAFEALVRRHLAAAHAVAFEIVQDTDEAEDVCQDAFINALQRIGQLERPERFRAWLLMIVRNRALDVTTSRRARTMARAEDAEHIPARGLASDHAERAELRRDLARALDTLTALQREVILRHDYEGKRHGEIARELGISAGSSRFHLHVARRAMRARLVKRTNGGAGP